VRNPALKVSAANGAVLAENTAWGSESAVAVSRLNSIAGAFPLPDASKDAVSFLRLPAGSYVVEARSTESSDPGEILVEVFMLP
jgi:hypothetical protein